MPQKVFIILKKNSSSINSTKINEEKKTKIRPKKVSITTLTFFCNYANKLL